MQNPEDFAWLCRTSPNTLFVLLVIIDSVCLKFFFIYLPKRQIQKKQTTKTIYSNKFFHNFHLSEFSFACSRLWASKVARRLQIGQLLLYGITPNIENSFVHACTRYMYVYECTCVCRYIFLWLMWFQHYRYNKPCTRLDNLQFYLDFFFIRTRHDDDVFYHINHKKIYLHTHVHSYTYIHVHML